jgi:hypothetical protein
VRRILPAVNLRPESLTLDAGAVRRARRRPPWMRSLAGTQVLLVYTGTVGAGRPDDAAPLACTRAVDALTDELRAECERLVVVWDDPDGMPHVVSCALTGDHRAGALLGSSWSDPRIWRDPMIDTS